MSSRLKIDLALRIGHGRETIRAGFEMCNELGDKIIRPVNTTDVSLLAPTTGEHVEGSVEQVRAYEIRKDAVKELSDALAGHLIDQLKRRDSFNGYQLTEETERNHDTNY